MKTGDKSKQAAWMYDLRVRERMLASGALDPKTLERFLTELPDLEGHYESLPFDQPALGRSGGQSSDGGL
jgi:hypothetical protein